MEEILWRNRFGEQIPLLKMETSYLYNTVKMIWNNVIAPEEPFGDVIHWEFNEQHYPEEYLGEIFAVGIEELVKRNDATTKEFIAHTRAVVEKETAAALASYRLSVWNVLE